MAYRFIILILILMVNLSNSFSQNDSDIFKKAQSTFGIIKVNFKDENGNIKHSVGSGFLIDGEYFATCFHVKVPPNGFKLVDGFIMCNFKEGGTLNSTHDSIPIDFEYVYKEDQYNFASHIYDSSDFATDFLVLKLKEKIASTPLSFSQDNINKGDFVYSIGYPNSLVFSKQLILSWKLADYPNRPEFYIMSIGNGAEGFSGTAIFDAKKNISGVIQRGFNKIDAQMEQDYKNGLIDPYIYNEMKNGFLKGSSVSISLNIDFIKKKYLIGFL